MLSSDYVINSALDLQTDPVDGTAGCHWFQHVVSTRGSASVSCQALTAESRYIP